MATGAEEGGSGVPPSELRRWVEQVTSGRVVAAHRLAAEAPTTVVTVERPTGTIIRTVLKRGALGDPELATEAAALVRAEGHGLSAPRVIAADLRGIDTGAPALLLTFVDGSADVPTRPAPEQLRELGRVAATIHAVTVDPCPELPYRPHHMPWVDFAADRRAGREPSTPLLDDADAVPTPVGGRHHTTLVHGDLWSGNTMWRDGIHVGTIDWEAAGVGHPGVDLGSLRLDVALLHGQGAAELVLSGWVDEAGHPDGVALWDVIAARNTRPDMSGFLPGFRRAGRDDLDAVLLGERRDRFLAAALAELR